MQNPVRGNHVHKEEDKPLRITQLGTNFLEICNLLIILIQLERELLWGQLKNREKTRGVEAAWRKGWKKKKLRSPNAMDVRPVMEVVKGPAFDMLQVLTFLYFFHL